MAKIKQLKELEEIIYPITKGEAVSLDNNSNVQIEMDKTIRAKDPVGVEPVEATVSTNMIQADAITTEKILDGSVTTDKLANTSVTTAKLADGSVTNAKIGSSAVKSSNIDWTTINLPVVTNPKITFGEATPKTVNTSYVNLYEYTVPSKGLYLIMSIATRGNNATTGCVVTYNILVNNVSQGEFYGTSVANYSGNHDVFSTAFAVASAEANQKIIIRAKKDRVAGPTLGCRYCIARIA